MKVNEILLIKNKTFKIMMECVHMKMFSHNKAYKAYRS